MVQFILDSQRGNVKCMVLVSMEEKRGQPLFPIQPAPTIATKKPSDGKNMLKN